jgi:hypothetical protein
MKKSYKLTVKYGGGSFDIYEGRTLVVGNLCLEGIWNAFYAIPGKRFDIVLTPSPRGALSLTYDEYGGYWFFEDDNGDTIEFDKTPTFLKEVSHDVDFRFDIKVCPK